MKKLVFLLYLAGLIAGVYVFQPENATNLPPQSLIFPSIVALYLASGLMCAVCFAVSRALRIFPDVLYVGNWTVAVYPWHYMTFCIGLLPISCSVYLDNYNPQKGKEWVVTLPSSLAMVALGLCLVCLRNYVFGTAATLTLWNYPAYTLLAMMSLSIILQGVMSGIQYMIDCAYWSRHFAPVFLFVVLSAFAGLLVTVASHWDALVNYLYVGWA